MPAKSAALLTRIVEAAEGLHRCVGRRAGRLDRADIGRDEERASATCRDVGGDRLAARRVDVRDDDRGTLARERACVGFADAAGGAGYDRDLVLESHRPSWPALPQGRDSSPDFSQPGSRWLLAAARPVVRSPTLGPGISRAGHHDQRTLQSSRRCPARLVGARRIVGGIAESSQSHHLGNLCTGDRARTD